MVTTKTPRHQVPDAERIRPTVSATTTVGWFFASLTISLILYWPSLNSFFLGDDISNIANVAPQLAKGWLDAFRPISNGFFRPAILLTTRALVVACGLRPIFFHLACLILHSLVCVLTGFLARCVWKESFLAAWLAVGLMASHLGAYGVATRICNIGEPLLAIGFISGLLAWDQWLERGEKKWLTATAFGFAFALASKETGIMFPALMTLWVLFSRRDAPAGRLHAEDERQPETPHRGVSTGENRKDDVRLARRIILVFGVADLVYAGWFVGRQSQTGASYSAGDMVSASPKNFIRQLADYSSSAFLPYLHVIEPPGGSWGLSHSAYWGIRLVVLIFLLFVGVRFALNSAEGRMSFLILASLVPLLPACVLTGSPQVRFLYPALPFLCALLGGLTEPRPSGNAQRATFLSSDAPSRSRLGWSDWTALQKLAALGIALLWISFAVSLYLSPTLIRYRQTARDVERFTAAVQQIAPTWEPGSTVAIFNHPHPGEGEARWIYSQLLFDLFIPEAKAKLVLDAETPQTRYSYRFDVRELTTLKK